MERYIIVSIMTVIVLPVSIAVSFISVTPLFYINASPSAPAGIYMDSDGPPRAGDYCFVAKGDIPGPHPIAIPDLLLKRLRFCCGERVEITETEVIVCGRQVCTKRQAGNIEPYRFDGYLAPGEGLLLNDHPESFDGRYFGPLPVATLKKAVLVWGF